VRVLQISKGYPPHVGGVETVVQDFAVELARDKSVASEVVACGPKKNTSTNHQGTGVDVRFVRTYGRVLSLPFAPMFNSTARKCEADIVHCHEPFLLPALLARYGRQDFVPTGAKLLVWWHSDIVRQVRYSKVYNEALNRVLDRADIITVATPSHLTSSEALGKFASKVRVVPYGLDLSVVNSSNMSRPERLPSGFEKESFVLFIGRMVYYKGIEVLAKTLTRAVDIRMVCVGEGPLANLIDEVAATRKGVVRLPHLARSELNWLLSQCEMLVLPSIHRSEAFGLVQLEAMSFSKPVVSSALGTGVDFVNQNDVTGITFSPGDALAFESAIKFLLENPNQARKMGESGLRSVESTYSLTSATSILKCLYREILE
jgi:glycosyltransferase involved in cell wall biosynthesis